MRLFTWLADGLHGRIDAYRIRELAALDQHRADGTSTSALARSAELHVALADFADTLIRRRVTDLDSADG